MARRSPFLSGDGQSIPLAGVSESKRPVLFLLLHYVGTFNRVIFNIQKRHSKESEKKGKDIEKINSEKISNI
ncbi:hypothetical protein BFO01nite_48250 [Brevibacillus formosus]|uniref:Uncharacterized protein n=1 Tax=Brevibacillus formosus TaxID=54913 RepID=A0ABQ0TBL9_9BACL|nr:hypothetical protein BFO01nite_48250 [Brevibacillus formosus]